MSQEQRSRLHRLDLELAIAKRIYAKVIQCTQEEDSEETFRKLKQTLQKGRNTDKPVLDVVERATLAMKDTATREQTRLQGRKGPRG